MLKPTSVVSVAILCAFALLVGACRSVPFPDPPPTTGSWTPKLERLHAEPDVVHGGRIVDADSREVLLRGVNVNAFVDYWRYGTFPTTFPFTEADARAIAGTGWNTVRLLISWSRVEPQPGHYDDAYLREVRSAVRMLAKEGVYSVIDLHQDAWGPSLAARPGEVCPAGQEPAFGWDGAPAWATLDGGAARCTIAGIRELSPAVRAAFAAFWSDAPGPDGVGIRTRYARMLGH
ncbi:MAG: cellulase family glycosylhydrolase, partial [Acidimicrobiia bacterium]